MFDELAHARDTRELLAGVYVVVRAALADACAPTSRPPTRSSITRRSGSSRPALRDERARGRVGAARPRPRCRRRATGLRRIEALLAAAGGLLDDGERRRAAARPALRGRSARPRPRRMPRRALRRPVQPSALIDDYYDDEARPGRRARLRARLQAPARDGRAGVDGADPRRARPAVGAPARAEPPALGRGAPRDDGRGRARSASGVPFHRFPIEIPASPGAQHARSTPREAHLLLWVIEQDLMPRDDRQALRVRRSPALHGDPLLIDASRTSTGPTRCSTPAPGGARSSPSSRAARRPRRPAPRRVAPLRRGRRRAGRALRAGGVVAGVPRRDAGRR